MFRQYFWVEGSWVPRPAIRTPRPVSLDVAQHLADLLLTFLWGFFFEILNKMHACCLTTCSKQQEKQTYVKLPARSWIFLRKGSCDLPTLCQVHLHRVVFCRTWTSLRCRRSGFHGLKTVWCSSQSLCGRLYTDMFTWGVCTHVWFWNVLDLCFFFWHAFSCFCIFMHLLGNIDQNSEF